MGSTPGGNNPRTTLSSSVAARGLAVKAFPRSTGGVLLPVNNRHAAAFGVCMFTACRPAVLRAQTVAFQVVRRLGARVIPGRVTTFEFPGDRDERIELLDAWQAAVGPIDSLTVYQRRQAYRSGLTLIAVLGSQPIALIKVRNDAHSLKHEYSALTALAELDGSAHPSFRAPVPIAFGSAGSWTWSAQQVVFTRPHRPSLIAPPGLFEQISDVLRTLDVGSDGQVPSHRDVTPWNLRRDHHGAVWLFDWEDWGLAPAESDRAYFCAASRAVGGPPMPAGLPASAIAYHRAIVEDRQRLKAPGVTLPGRVLAAFDEATQS